MQDNTKKPRKFTTVDTNNWKIVTHTGKTIVATRKDGSKVALKGYNGYLTAQAVARQAGGVAVRE